MAVVPDHFSAVAGKYAEHRPSYPPALAAYLAGLCADHALAWDCGTGSGQAAVLLGDHFERVVATDLSVDQLSHAQAHPRVTYRVGREGESGLADRSCDLVTAAQAAHWFNLPAFYAEARRVLGPAGILAIWGYARIQIGAGIDPILKWFELERVGIHWPPGRELATSEYRTLPFPFTRIDPPAFVMERRWTRAEFLGYVESWSAVERCQRAEGRNPVPELTAKLEPLWPTDEHREIRWPIHMLVGKTS